LSDPQAEPEVLPADPLLRPISADADKEPDPLAEASNKLAELDDKLAEAEAAQFIDQLDAREHRLAAFAAQTDAMEAALEADKLDKLAEILGEQP
jgi:hypothetical protein